MSVKAHRTTGAQTTEPGHHNGEFVNDVRVSPIDEGRRRRRGRTVTCGTTTPGLEPADLLRGHAEQHEVGVVVKTAVTVHHVGARRTSFWGTLGPFRVGKKCVKKCHRVNPGRTTLHVSQIQVPRDNDLQNLSSPRDDTSDEVPKLQFVDL